MPENKLIPVFVPALANVLAATELKNGKPLTAAQIELIRDKSACIMMEATDAEKMTASRGFRDVNPTNCWADWHRLRVQMTGKGFLPKIVLRIPGDDNFRGICEGILDAEKLEHEFRPHDEKLAHAFKASSVTWPSLKSEDLESISKHTTVLYVLSKNLTAAEAPVAALRFLEIGRRLLTAGGIAVKCDSSGISHPRDRWLNFNQVVDRGPMQKWSALFHGYVVYPIASNDDFYTCGMHLLGAPDLIVSKKEIQSSKGEISVAAVTVELFRAFATYLLAECPVGDFVSGHTFSTDRDSPRYRITWEPCHGFAEDDFFFNSFGRWRFTLP